MPRDGDGVKQRIIAVLRRAGEIDANELFEIIYQHHRIRPQRTALKMHIHELRKAGHQIYAYQPEQRQWVYGWGKKPMPHEIRAATVKRRLKRGCVYGYGFGSMEAAE
jgi:hypothetical protein